MTKRRNKKTSEERKKLFVRLMCLFLAVLMVGGVLYYAIAFLFYEIFSLEPDSAQNPLMTVGIRYGEDSEAGFEMTTTHGYIVGSAVITEDDRSFTEIWRLSNQNVTAAIDYNLSRYGGAYRKEYSSGYVIGMYHIEAGGVIATRSACEQQIERVRSLIGNAYSVFPGYINGTYRVYVGDFSTRERAENALSLLTGLSSAMSTRIIGTAATTVSLIDHTTNTVLLEYDCGSASYVGVEPIAQNGETVYIKSDANYLYPGAMVFRRYADATTDGVEAINLLPLETYITGVLPWEISNSWTFEAQRVFAIAARTFAVTQKGRHFSADGFDICPNQHCQAYRGCSRTNENVLAAVTTTKGMVVSYEGKPATIAYASSFGGESIPAGTAWGGSNARYPYLTSIKTPWEQYADYENGVWVDEVSPYTLCEYLYSKGYYELSSGYISSITVNSRYGDTGYIDSITFTDSGGHSATVNASDMIRSALARYVYSANFVIGKGSVEYSYEVVTNLEISVAGQISAPTGPAYPGLFEEISLSAPITAQTGDGILSGTNETLVAVTSYGRRALTGETVSVLTANGYETLVAKIASGQLPPPSYTSSINITNPGELNPTDLKVSADTVTVTKTYTASSGDNFVFAGKGFGHGVGISQYGTLDLANAGVPAELILSTYLPGTELIDFTKLKP
ncbi:MAG: SpoIID/LytB domain-containing protein [Eubacteriales bacterium]|nr:SpoIID/LytB domain-containing protein [Eubacteriales bacterium]